jgi:hypothetical protein
MTVTSKLRELSEKQVWSDDEFILAMRVFPRLLDVVEVAQSIKCREEIGGYGHEGIPELIKALQALERE